MVAYSCKYRFVGPIRAGLGIKHLNERGKVVIPGPLPKRQTIRADRKRHARPGEELQLYCGMRTKGCFLIGRARCVSVHRVAMKIGTFTLCIEIDGAAIGGGNIHDFARADGFAHGEDMLAFWQVEHKGVTDFEGVLIKWEPLT